MIDADDVLPSVEDAYETDGTATAKQRVGFGHPPHHAQFKKGHSGNPKGRPKGSKNVSTYIDEELKRIVTVTENGKRKKIPKAKALAKRVVNGAVAGETKMVPMLLNRDQAQADQQANGPSLAMPFTADDEAVIKSIVDRIRASEPLSPDHRSATQADASLGSSDHYTGEL